MTKPAAQAKPGVVLIHGREYETVAHRVKRFWELHPGWSLHTEIVSRDADAVVVAAKLLDESQVLRATGHSEEYRNASQINKTSALENAETSAIGRALAALGIGGTEFATANEVQNAIHQQAAKMDVRPNSGAGEGLTAERKKEIEKLASSIIDWFNAGSQGDAFATYDNAALEPDDKLFLWTFLSPSQRASIKKLGQEQRDLHPATQA